MKQAGVDSGQSNEFAKRAREHIRLGNEIGEDLSNNLKSSLAIVCIGESGAYQAESMKESFLNLDTADGQEFTKGAMLRDLIKNGGEKVCENWKLGKPALLFLNGNGLSECLFKRRNDFS